MNIGSRLLQKARMGFRLVDDLLMKVGSFGAREPDGKGVDPQNPAATAAEFGGDLPDARFQRGVPVRTKANDVFWPGLISHLFQVSSSQPISIEEMQK